VANHRIGTPREGDQAPFEVLDRIDETLAEAPAAAVVAAVVAEQAAEQTAREAVRSNWRWTNLAAVLVALVVSIATSSIAVYIATAASAEAGEARTLGESAQRTVDDALGKLKEANDQLAARGQAPVTTSADPDPSEAIQAAVLAKVLAQLPAPPATPTAEQVAAVLRPTVVAQVTGPNRDTLAALVADYFAPSGPAAAAIQAAVDRAYAANPPKNGVDGRNGVDGQSPPCLSEPAQCRGTDGTNGENGADSTVPGPVGPVGPPGPACPPGSHLETVTYVDLKQGPACVFD